MKKLVIFLLLLVIQFSAHSEWFNVNHPDTSKIEVIGNRGDTLFDKSKCAEDQKIALSGKEDEKKDNNNTIDSNLITPKTNETQDDLEWRLTKMSQHAKESIQNLKNESWMVITDSIKYEFYSLVAVHNDSLIVGKKGKISVIPITRINKIILDNGNYAITGAILGFHLGGIAGGLIGISLNGIFKFSRGEFAGLAEMFYGILIGSGVGTIVGGIIGANTKDELLFDFTLLNYERKLSIIRNYIFGENLIVDNKIVTDKLNEKTTVSNEILLPPNIETISHFFSLNLGYGWPGELLLGAGYNFTNVVGIRINVAPLDYKLSHLNLFFRLHDGHTFKDELGIFLGHYPIKSYLNENVIYNYDLYGGGFYCLSLGGVYLQFGLTFGELPDYGLMNGIIQIGYRYEFR